MDSSRYFDQGCFANRRYRNAYQHVLMHPHPKVVHIHFREQDEAVDVLARVDVLDRGSPSVSPNIGEIILSERATGSSLYHEGVRGICWHGDEIVRNCLPRMAPLLSFEEVILHRELAGRGGDFSLITTWGHYGCTAHLLRHEMAHAIWRHYPAYRKAATVVVAGIPVLVAKELLGRLMDCGYVNEGVPYAEQADGLINEMQACTYGGCRDRLHGPALRAMAPFKARLRLVMADFCPLLNDTGMLTIRRWRTLHDARQDASYFVRRGGAGPELREGLS